MLHTLDISNITYSPKPSGDGQCHYIGVGYTGQKMIEQVYKNELKGKFSTVRCRNYPHKKPKDHPAFKHYLLDMGHVSDGLLPREIYDILIEDDIYVLFVELGGISSTWIVHELARVLNQMNATFHVICGLPFRDIGKGRLHMVSGYMDRWASHPNIHFFKPKASNRGNKILIPNDENKKMEKRTSLSICKKIIAAYKS